MVQRQMGHGIETSRVRCHELGPNVTAILARLAGLDVMREANRAKAQQQQEAQRRVGLNVKGRSGAGSDHKTPRPADTRTRDVDRER